MTPRPVIAHTAEQANALNKETDDSEETQKEAAINWEMMNVNIIGQRPENGFALGRGPLSVVTTGWSAENILQLVYRYWPTTPHLSVQMPSIWYEVGCMLPNGMLPVFRLPGAWSCYRSQ